MWSKCRKRIDKQVQSGRKDMAQSVFLTFLVITYQRPAKIARLLRYFLDDRWQSLKRMGLQIVIADDHSEDNTREVLEPIITALKAQGWSVKYIYRTKNLRGDRNLYEGYSQDSQGRYVWFLCDDDMLDVANAVLFVKSIAENRPVAAICGFRQGTKHQFGNRQLGEQIRIITEFSESVKLLSQYPKTSTYVLKRIPSLNL